MLKLSLISPSFNQAAFIERTLESVASQSVLPFEHLIFDAGSTDGALDKLRDYEARHPYATVHVGRDRGQTHAINLGYGESRGDILAWLNTDDRYSSPTVLERVLRTFESHSDIDVLYGRGRFVDAQGNLLREAFINTDADALPRKLLHSVGILQPALFMRRSVFERVGPLDETLHYCFDYEYWVRMAQARARFLFIDEQFCEAILHTDSKTMGQRIRSLTETVEMARDRMGFAAAEWLERLADAELNGADGILTSSKIRAGPLQDKTKELFQKYNKNEHSISRIMSMAHTGEAKRTLAMLRDSMTTYDFYLATAFDSNFFHAGMTQIAQVQKCTTRKPAVLVYDLGLSRDEKSILGGIRDVFVVSLPTDEPGYLDGYFSPRTYGFKSYVARHVSDCAPAGVPIIWMDAGIAPIRDLQPVLDVIEAEDVLFVDHDDKGAWPFFNITFTSDAGVHALKATTDELLSPHIRAGLFGFKAGGRFQRLFAEAHEYSRDPRALAGEKHPDRSAVKPQLPSKAAERKRAREDAKFRGSLSLGRLRELFGYYGHRHDQSILSILAARHRAPIQSARRFCMADDASSALSKRNWQTSFTQVNDAFSREIPFFYTKSGVVCMQHRGTFLNHQGIAFNLERRKRAIVLGNGPSMADFDFARFEGFDVFGMNAAYRYWDRIGWYPQYYSCLDLVVGLSHADEIKRLIENAGKYGIRKFLLRNNLIETLGDVRNRDRVMNFDTLRRGVEVLAAPTISTGSHTAGWAAYLGYKEIFLLGVDCNYVEVVDGAAHVKGTELEIINPSSNNPNYFFSDYQQPGDRYNIPNPGRDIHLTSWREIAERLPPTGATVVNANMRSKVDAFDFCTFEEVEKGGPLAPLAAREVLGAPAEPASPIVDRAEPAPSGFARELHVAVDETEVVSHLLSDRSGPTHVMFDAGAHFGTSASYFHKLGWTIHCFEPDASNRQKLSARYQDIGTVTIDSRALSDAPASGAAFYTSKESSGISGLHAFSKTHRQSARVDVTTIKDVVAERGIDRIDFLKIDVEGLDFAVLKGVPWDALKPDVIECEFEDAKTVPLGHTWKDIAEFLHEQGYTLYISEWHPIIRYGVPHDWRRVVPYPGVDIPSDAWGNILAFREDPGYEAIRSAFSALVTTRRPETRSVEHKRDQAGAAAAVSVSRASAAAAPPPPRPFYADFGDWLRARAPGAFVLLRLIRRTLVGLWRRRLWTAPAILLVAALFALGFAPALAGLRNILWIGAGFLAVLFALLYLALRVRSVALALWTEASALRKLASDADARLQQKTREVADLKRRLETVSTAASARDVRLREIEQEMEQNARAIPELKRRLDSIAAGTASFEAQLAEIEMAIQESAERLESRVADAMRSAAEGDANLTRRLEQTAKAGEERSQKELKTHLANLARLRERIAAGERQIGDLRYPDAPRCLVFFGHHKCASRFFRTEVFAVAAEATGARIRRYEIKNPPFHYSMSDDLDLCNMSFDGIGENGRDVVLFSNATARSLARIKRTTEDWRGLRILRDPRQVFVSNYFHHKGGHNTEHNGWIWDQLAHDQPILRQLPAEEGLLYELDSISKQILETQVFCAFNDPRVMTVKIEAFSQDPKEHLRRISEFLGVPDIAGVDLARTSANRESGPWQNHFTSRLRAVFKERYGQNLIDMGYAEDFDW